MRLFILLCSIVLINGECNDLCFNRTTAYESCSCADDCHIYNDCCSDRLQNSTLSTNHSSSTFACNIKTADFHIYSVATCNPNPNLTRGTSLKEKCENYDSLTNNSNTSMDDDFLIHLVPVFSRQTNLIYKNIYCAVCNIERIDLDRVLFLEIDYNFLNETANDNETESASKIIRNQQTLFDTIRKSQNTELIYNLPLDGNESLPFRICKKAIDTCADSANPEINSQCASEPTAYRYSHFGVLYRNKYCAMCNHQSVDGLQCLVLGRNFASASASRQSLQLLFDLSNLQGEISIAIKIKFNNKIITSYNTTTGNCTLYSDDCNVTSDEKNSTSHSLYELKCRMYERDADSEDAAKKYITIIGQLVSIISLFLLLGMYLFNKVLRNLPGKILICLSVSLLMSQIFFLISTYMTHPFRAKVEWTCYDNLFASSYELMQNLVKVIDCYVLGLLTHYFYLSFFTWSNVMAYDLYKTLNKLSPNSKSFVSDSGSDGKKLFVYSLYAWLLPMVLVSGLFSKQLFIHQMSYAYNNCFISTSIDLLVFFVAPVAFILLFNLYFLLISVNLIRQVDQVTKKYLNNKPNRNEYIDMDSEKTRLDRSAAKKQTDESNKNEKKRFLLFLKLFILTGMSWILGLVSSFSKNSFIWYVYVFLNSLQGLFILFAYAFNIKTRNVLKNSSVYRTLSSMGSNRKYGSRSTTSDTFT